MSKKLYNASTLVIARKLALEIDREALISNLMTRYSCDRANALDILEKGNSSDANFHSGWNIGCMHGYYQALIDIIEHLKDNEED